MPNIIDILARALSLRQETALNSITPNRAGGIMYDTLLVLNQMQLEGGALLISKVYASVSAMEADTTPTSDLTGRALKPGQLVVIVTSDSSSSDMGSEYRFNGPGSWTYVGKVGGLPLDTVPTQSSTKGITSGGVYTALAAMKAEGYKYIGIATPGSGGTAPGTPNQPVFYIAGPGSYPNFGSITVASGYLGFIKYSSGSWSVESVAVGKDYDAQISALDGQITQLEAKVDKDIYGVANINKNFVWSDGYVSSPGKVASSTTSKFCQPILFRAGERLSYKTGTAYGYAVVEVADDTPLAVGDTGFVVSVLINAATANNVYTYIFENDTYVVISCQKASNEIGVTVSQSASIESEIEVIRQELNGPSNITGKAVKNDGTLFDALGWAATPFIPYTSGNSIDWNYDSGTPSDTTGKVIALYDQNKVFLASWGCNTSGGNRTISASAIATNAPGAVFIRASYVPFGKANVIVGNNLVWTEEDGGISKRVDNLEKKVINTDGIADGAVIPVKTSIFNMTDNLFDKADGGVEDGYLDSSGNVSSSSSYKTSGFIPVTPEIVYYFSPISPSITARVVCFYDANKGFISGSLSTSVSQATAPASAKYVRVSYSTSYWENGQVTKGTMKNYVSFGKIKSEYIDGNADDEIPAPVLVLPSRVYALAGVENSIYHKNYTSQVNFPYFLNSTGANWLFRERCLRTSGGSSADLSVSLKKFLPNSDSVINTITAKTVIGNPSTNNGAKNVNIIGDSFTYNGTWFNYIYESCPNLAFVGMRKSYNTDPSLRAEGRGGWTLSEYFQPHDDVTPTHLQPFSPFMHPAGYKYYGVLEFWKAIVNENSQYTYGTDGFDDYKTWFDTDGYKLNPSAGDMMYDGTNDKYVYFDGSSWVDYSGTPDFVFDYAKYIDVWQIASPDYVIVMLGANDWFGNYQDSWAASWNAKMDTLIASVQAYATANNKTITIGICTNTTFIGTPNNSYHRNPFEQHRFLFMGRKNVIDTYDNETQRGNDVFVVDSGACLDPDYGFTLEEQKPFTFYSGSERELYDSNGIHPSTDGYKQLGVCVAAFIQATR